MIDLSRRVSALLWGALVCAAAIGLLAVVVLNSLVDLLEKRTLAQLLVAVAVAVGALMLSAKVILFFSYPPKVRYIYGITAFIMGMMVLMLGGMWVAVPLSHVEVVMDSISLNVDAGDATITTCVVFPVGVVALLWLVTKYPDYSKQTA